MPKSIKAHPLSLQKIELKVRMCCTGCERIVKSAIHKLRGGGLGGGEPSAGAVTVIGYVDRNKVLKAVRRAGKRAEFWPYPNPPLYFTSTNNYFKDMTNSTKRATTTTGTVITSEISTATFLSPIGGKIRSGTC